MVWLVPSPAFHVVNDPPILQLLPYSFSGGAPPGLSQAVCPPSSRSRSTPQVPQSTVPWPGAACASRGCVSRPSPGWPGVCHGLLSSSGCEKGPGVEPLKPGSCRVNPYSVIDITPPGRPAASPRPGRWEGEGGACMPSGYSVPVPCGYAVPSSPAAAAAGPTPVPCCPPRPADPAGRGPWRLCPGCSVGTSQGETGVLSAALWSSLGSALHLGLLPPDTRHTPGLRAALSTLCASVPSCRPFAGDSSLPSDCPAGVPGSWNQGWGRDLGEQVGVR